MSFLDWFASVDIDGFLNRLPVQGFQGIHVTQSTDDTGDVVIYVIPKAPGDLSNVSGVEESSSSIDSNKDFIHLSKRFCVVYSHPKLLKNVPLLPLF